MDLALFDEGFFGNSHGTDFLDVAGWNSNRNCKQKFGIFDRFWFGETFSTFKMFLTVFRLGNAGKR